MDPVLPGWAFYKGVNEPTVLAGNNTTMVILSLLFQKKKFWLLEGD